MALDHIIKHTCRFNIKNEQHRRVNEFLSTLSPDICKSKSQFMITATAYYIDHFGEELIAEPAKKKGTYVTKEELEVLQQKMIDAAISAAKDEIIRISVFEKRDNSMPLYVEKREPEMVERSVHKDDDTISDYALSMIMDGMEE